MEPFFGSHLSDELFYESSDNTSKKTNTESETYLAKICEPKWFLSTEERECTKFQADYFYSLKEYTRSSKLYKECINSDLTNNSLNQRDCLEGLIRSLIKLKQYEECIEYGDVLHENSCNNDQLLVSKSLMALVCHSLGNYKDEIKYIQYCVNYHPFNADLWLRLAYCYANIYEKRIPFICHDELNFSNTLAETLCPELHIFTDKCPCLTCPCHRKNKTNLSVDKQSNIISACFVRANLLYQGGQTRSFSKMRKIVIIEKSRPMEKKVDNNGNGSIFYALTEFNILMKKLTINPEISELVQKKLSEDFKQSQETEPQPSIKVIEIEKSFEEKWLYFIQ